MRSKQQRKNQVPVHKATFGKGFEIKYIRDQPGQHQHLDPHRDDYYIFFLQESGTMQLMIDFELHHAVGNTIGYICPGQVHRYLATTEVAGWFLSVDIPLVQNTWRNIFEKTKNEQHFIPLQEASPFAQCLQLIWQQHNSHPTGMPQRKVMHALVDAFLGMVATTLLQTATQPGRQHDRAYNVTHQFRELVKKNVLTVKSPAAYADMMNLSLSYLNELVKGQTSFPVSHWIQQESLLEAKRLLYYTDLTTKEVAFRIGYDDHTYFSRVFRKLAGETPLDFRARYRDLSNHYQ
ncbi:AraC family transcriptional regulator [Chitinophaga sp. HK235]|uniref:helix-turn-helix domain-containing protein n=1 Tax=Chitinophaga sp. HK235 TaxID=2952571 RepID=UPI001BAA4E92|nr:AraC family transcriptional regulator [Chitinophaga sp. HK235]